MNTKIVKFLCLNFSIAFLLFALNDNIKIFIKYLIFGETLSSEEIEDQNLLDLKIESKFNKSVPPNLILFDNVSLEKINQSIKKCEVYLINPTNNFTEYDCKAQILSKISVPSFTDKCLNKYELRERINLVRSGKSCCSDAVESFILHSNVIGLRTREVHTKTHSFAEYFDSNQNKWKLIDIYYKKLFLDKNKNILSSFAVFNKVNTSQITIYSYSEKDYTYDFEYFMPRTSDSFLAYKLGNDILPVYNFYSKFPKIVPFYIKNFFSLLNGVNPSYLIITKSNFILYYKLLLFLITSFILIFYIRLGYDFLKIKLYNN